MALTEWPLPTGHMALTTEPAEGYQVADLLDLGARQNPRRPFVFVSRVLGKHVPCAPAVMRAAQTALAAELGGEPALFIGMAETATGLGEGVFSAWSRAGGGDSGLYIATTRYPIGAAAALDFTESHSHATALKLFLPGDDALRRRLASLRKVVLVDDEISTGNTFASLVRALRAYAPHLSRIDVVALTDFSGGQARERLLALSGVERVKVHALLSGSFQFTPAASVVAAAAPAQREVSCRRSRMMPATSRLGITAPLNLPAALVEQCYRRAAGRTVRLLATGEFMYPVQCLGEQLEQRGCRVLLQSTTRSPLMLGAAIASLRQVSDPYGEGIANYIYNLPDRVAEQGDGSDEWRCIVHETGDNEQVRALCAELDAEAVDLAAGALTVAPSGCAVA